MQLSLISSFFDTHLHDFLAKLKNFVITGLENFVQFYHSVLHNRKGATRHFLTSGMALFSVSMVKFQFTIKHHIIIILSRYVSQSVGEVFRNIFESSPSCLFEELCVYVCIIARFLWHGPTVRDFGLGFFFIWSVVIVTLSPGETCRYRRRPLGQSSN